jgi:hypothetical protein
MFEVPLMLTLLNKIETLFAQLGMLVKSMAEPLVAAVVVALFTDPPFVKEPTTLPVTLPTTAPVNVPAVTLPAEVTTTLSDPLIKIDPLVPLESLFSPMLIIILRT